MNRLKELTLGVCLVAFSTVGFCETSSSSDPAPAKEDPIYEGCVYTCKGSYCDPAFSDVKFAIMFIEEAEDDCEKNGNGSRLN